MKLNLLMASDDILAGYTNIDPYPQIQNNQQTFSAEKTMGNIDNLDYICEDAQAQEILATDVLDYINISNKIQTIDNWVKKLAHGASLSVGGMDLAEIVRNIRINSITFDEAQLLLYGHPAFPFGARRGVLTLEKAQELLSQRGLRIVKSQIDSFRYLVTGVRQ